MTFATTERLALSGALLAIVGLPVFGDCPVEEQRSTASGEMVGGDAARDTHAREAWDPIWHETKPKNWPRFGPEKNPDCGSGCRVALNLPMTNQPGLGRHGHTPEWIVSTTPVGIGFFNPGSRETYAVPDEPGSLVFPAVFEDQVSYVRSFGIADGQVEVTRLITGETKVVLRYTPATSWPNSVEATSLNSKYAFWVLGGIHARNLETGAEKLVAPGSCFSYCATEKALICDAGRIYSIDPETGQTGMIDESSELQTDGSCSPDHAQYVWVDYRDPPGPGSSDVFQRSGGEIYWHDFAKSVTRRLTFDSPDSPRGKLRPAVGGNLVVWSEPGAGKEPNPQTLGSLEYASTAIGIFDLESGKRCHTTPATVGPLGYKTIYGRHLYAGWLDKVSNRTWLIDIDLDDQSFSWQCTTTAGWTTP